MNIFRLLAQKFGFSNKNTQSYPEPRTYTLTDEAKAKSPPNVVALGDDLMSYVAARTFDSGKIIFGNIEDDGKIVLRVEGEDKPEVIGHVNGAKSK